MNRRVIVVVFCVILALVFIGQGFSQTRLIFKGVNYASSALKAMPVDKDHVLLVGEQMGIETNDKPVFNNMSTHFSVVLYFENGIAHWRAFGAYTDKDGDAILWEIWDNPAVMNGGKGKVIGATGKFAGMDGTCDYVNEYPKGWPESTGRIICRESWNLTLKNPL